MDNENKRSGEMTAVTNGISAMRGLLISNRFLALVLVVVQLGFIFSGFRLFSPLYIILLDLAFPMIMEGLIKSRTEPKTEDDLPLPLLRKKYRYSATASKALSFGFLLNVVMLIAWHYNFTANPPEQEMLRGLPSLILIAYVVVRLCIWAFYLLMFKKFPHKLMK